MQAHALLSRDRIEVFWTAAYGRCQLGITAAPNMVPTEIIQGLICSWSKYIKSSVKKIDPIFPYFPYFDTRRQETSICIGL